MAAVVGSRLRSIDLSRLMRFSHLGLSVLAKGCENLVEIDVSYCARFGDMEAAVVSNAKNLQTLKLVRCQMVSDLGLGWIAVGCGKLQVLNLRWCVGVGDLGVELVAIKCKELRSLDVSYLQVCWLPCYVFNVPFISKNIRTSRFSYYQLELFESVAKFF